MSDAKPFGAPDDPLPKAGPNGAAPDPALAVPAGFERPSPWFLIAVQLEEGAAQLLTFLTAEEIQAFGGLPGSAVAGRLVDPEGSLEPDNFMRNLAFVEALHVAIMAHYPTTAAWIEGARSQGSGRMFVSFGRVKGEGRIQKEDLAGSFDVQDGAIVEGSYRPEAEFDILTGRGVIVFGEALRAVLVEVVRPGPK